MPNPIEISALVWMLGASGAGGAAIDNASDHQSEVEVVKYFREKGFTVSDPVNGQFSITASPDRFESVFDEELTVSDQEVAHVQVTTADGDLELNISTLPDSLQESIYTVTFSEPPDFGPNDY